MDNNKTTEFNILCKLKEKLKEVKHIDDEHFGSKRWDGKSDKAPYYLYDKNDNLFEKPKKGIVLGTGVDAIRSSAAMIFNLLGQEDVNFNGTEYSIKYEGEYEAIKDEKKESHNAHLDAVLKNEEGSEMIAVEAKMLEWLNSPKNLAPVYLKEEYYPKENDQKELFIAFFKRFVNNKLIDGRYAHKNKRYDAIQMTIHILALYNFCCGDGNHPKKITLYNVVWSYNCPEYCTEKKEADSYIKQANDVFKPVFEKKNIDFKVEYVTFSSFKEKIKISDDRASYLKRYDILCD